MSAVRTGVIHDTRRRRGEHIEWEMHPQYCREKRVIVGGDYDCSTVMGEITATGQLTQLAPAAADGSQVAVAVLYNPTDASAGPVTGTVNDGHVIYREEYLLWPAGITDEQKATAIKQLNQASGQKVRSAN